MPSQSGFRLKCKIGLMFFGKGLPNEVNGFQMLFIRVVPWRRNLAFYEIWASLADVIRAISS